MAAGGQGTLDNPGGHDRLKIEGAAPIPDFSVQLDEAGKVSLGGGLPMETILDAVLARIVVAIEPIDSIMGALLYRPIILGHCAPVLRHGRFDRVLTHASAPERIDRIRVSVIRKPAPESRRHVKQGAASWKAQAGH